jgi:Domain of unknown function (DUF4389)
LCCSALERLKPLYRWFLAIPQYFVLAGLLIGACLGIIAGFFVVLFTGEYPEAIRNFLVSVFRYGLRVEAYVGLLTDRYPPFNLAPEAIGNRSRAATRQAVRSSGPHPTMQPRLLGVRRGHARWIRLAPRLGA